MQAPDGGRGGGARDGHRTTTGRTEHRHGDRKTDEKPAAAQKKGSRQGNGKKKEGKEGGPEATTLTARSTREGEGEEVRYLAQAKSWTRRRGEGVEPWKTRISSKTNGGEGRGEVQLDHFGLLSDRKGGKREDSDVARKVFFVVRSQHSSLQDACSFHLRDYTSANTGYVPKNVRHMPLFSKMPFSSLVPKAMFLKWTVFPSAFLLCGLHVGQLKFLLRFCLFPFPLYLPVSKALATNHPFGNNCSSSSKKRGGM